MFRFFFASVACVLTGVEVSFLRVGVDALAVHVDPLDESPLTPPHIIFIVADDLGWHDTSLHDSTIPTPTIDRLARQGRFLENYYVQPTCAPTRATIMTGRHMTSHGIFYPFDNGEAAGLRLSETLLPEVLSDAGYSTHAVGKWHLGFCQANFTPTFRGFDSFYGFYGEGTNYFTHDFKGGYDFRLDDRKHCGHGCSILHANASGQYSTTLFAQRAVAIISNHDVRQPLFLYYAMQAVHTPVPAYCPGDLLAKLDGSMRNTSFACALMLADHSIHRIVDELEQKDMLSRSIIVFSSDNGGAVSTVNWRVDDEGSSNWPLRGGKHTLFEGGVRVVGFVWTGWWRDHAQPYSGIMGSVDWFPTLLDAAHITVPPKVLEGVSHWRALALKTEPPRNELFIAMTQFGFTRGMTYAFRCNRWKLILGVSCTDHHAWGWSGPNGSKLVQNGTIPEWGTTLLFDLAKDPQERVDLSGEQPNVLEWMTKKLEPYKYVGDRLHKSHSDFSVRLPSLGKWEPWL